MAEVGMVFLGTDDIPLPRSPEHGSGMEPVS